MDVFLKQRFSKRWHLSFSSFYLADSSFLEIEGDPNGGRNSLLQVHFPGQRRERLVDSVWKGEGNLLVFLFFFFLSGKMLQGLGVQRLSFVVSPPTPSRLLHGSADSSIPKVTCHVSHFLYTQVPQMTVQSRKSRGAGRELRKEQRGEE